jgi:predicted nuclease of predicted toxin-antitoxin system
MQFFVDHCVPRSIRDTLGAEGHEIIRLSARLRVDAEDSAVIEEAQKIGAVLLSLNGDFADLLRYPPEEYGGIVALQVRNRPEAIPSIMDRLLGYLQQHPDRSHYLGKLLLVEAHRIRVRRGT